jgi:hypothetical protein
VRSKVWGEEHGSTVTSVPSARTILHWKVAPGTPLKVNS